MPEPEKKLFDLTDEGLIERMNDLGGFVVPDEPAGINTFAGMDAVLRQLAGRLAEARTAVVLGQIGGAEAERRARAALDDAEGKILGRDAGMEPSFWNQPHIVGGYLKRTLGLDEPPDKCVRRVLEAFFAEFMTAVLDFEQDGLTEDEVRTAADGLVETYAHHFLGIPIETAVEVD